MDVFRSLDPAALMPHLSPTHSAALPPSAPNFDRVARSYRLAERLTLGSALVRARTAHLPALAHARHGLILGDGDGRFLAALLHHNPLLQATAVDSSRTMLQLLTRRCAFSRDRLRTLHADALAGLPVAPTCDLVATHFFLDCFSEPDLLRLVPAIRALLVPGALWVLSEFRIPPTGPLRLPARLLVRALYHAFRLFTGLQPTRLPEYTPILLKAGLVPISIRHSLGGILSAELWQLPNLPSASHPPVN